MDLTNARIFDSELGHFVSEEHRRIAEVINEYEPTLSLVWIPPDKRSFDDTHPFAILHSPSNRQPYIVRKLSEQQINSDLVAWLWSNDQARNGRDLNAYLDAQQAAEKALQMKRSMEIREEANDVALHIVKGKNWYKHNGKVFS